MRSADEPLKYTNLEVVQFPYRNSGFTAVMVPYVLSVGEKFEAAECLTEAADDLV